MVYKYRETYCLSGFVLSTEMSTERQPSCQLREFNRSIKRKIVISCDYLVNRTRASFFTIL